MSLINDDTYGDYNIRLKTLEKEYQVLLNQYLEVKKSYIEALEEKAKGNINLVTLENTNMENENGPYKIIQDVSDAEKCKALCIQNKCSAATYFSGDMSSSLSENPVCSFYDTNGRLNAMPRGKNNKYTTFISNDIDKLRQMFAIIMQLLNINYQIIQTIENIDPSYMEEIDAKKIRGKELYDNYKQLINERNIVNEKLDEYNALAQKYSEENINAGKQYYLMNIAGFLVTFIILYALREMFGLEVSFVPIFILSFVFFLTLNLGVPSGFLIWLSVLLLLLILYFTNMA